MASEPNSKVIEFIIEFEIALAQAQEEAGMIPSGTAAAIAGIRGFEPNMQDLQKGADSDGVMVPALLRQLRENISGSAGSWLHYGVTSQDATDTALVLLLKESRQTIAGMLKKVVTDLISLADAHKRTPLAARTRHRMATPISFGFLVSSWLSPLARCFTWQERLAETMDQIQMGGSGGVSAAFDNPRELAAEVALKLGLKAERISWHSERDSLATFSHWLVLLTGSAAKIGEDLLFLGADEVGEIHFRDGGHSSTMPHKENPVKVETLVAKHKIVRAHDQLVRDSLTNLMQRDGRNWPLELYALPIMVEEARQVLALLQDSIEGITVDAERMLENLNLNHQLAYSESARFSLSEQLSPDVAGEVVDRAMMKARQTGEGFLTVLRREEIVETNKIKLDDVMALSREMENSQMLVDRSIAIARKYLDRQ